MVRREGAPCDFVYVHNFAEPDRPRPIRLAAGQGRRLRTELEAKRRGQGSELMDQLILYRCDIDIPDPMYIFEEITRHRLLQGMLPIEDLYQWGIGDVAAP